MNVSLTPELEKFVQEEVASGRYASASEVVRHSLRKMEEEERWKNYVRREVALGLEDIKAGRVVTEEELKASLAERRQNRKKQSAA